MSEPKVTIAAKLKIWLSKDNIHYLYLLLSVLGSLFGAYELFIQTKRTENQQSPQIVINIPKDSLISSSNSNNKPITPAIKDISVVPEKPKDSVDIEKDSAGITGKQTQTLRKSILFNKPIKVKREIEQAEPINEFGFVKNKSKTKTAEIKNSKPIIIPCTVLGDYKVADGNILKVRTMEDYVFSEIPLKKNTSISGIMTVKGSLVTVEFKNKDLPVRLYGMDKDKNFEFPYQESFLDGYKIYLTNKINTENTN